jgi:hypothetical protein
MKLLPILQKIIYVSELSGYLDGITGASREEDVIGIAVNSVTSRDVVGNVLSDDLHAHTVAICTCHNELYLYTPVTHLTVHKTLIS